MTAGSPAVASQMAISTPTSKALSQKRTGRRLCPTAARMDVDDVALTTLEIVAAEVAVALDVADDGAMADRRPSSHSMRSRTPAHLAPRIHVPEEHDGPQNGPTPRPSAPSLDPLRTSVMGSPHACPLVKQRADCARFTARNPAAARHRPGAAARRARLPRAGPISATAFRPEGARSPTIPDPHGASLAKAESGCG